MTPFSGPDLNRGGMEQGVCDICVARACAHAHRADDAQAFPQPTLRVVSQSRLIASSVRPPWFSWFPRNIGINNKRVLFSKIHLVVLVVSVVPESWFPRSTRICSLLKGVRLRNPCTTPTKLTINIASSKLGVVRILPFP